MCCQKTSRPTPKGETTPMPVMTTPGPFAAPTELTEPTEPAFMRVTIIEARVATRRTEHDDGPPLRLGRDPVLRGGARVFPLRVRVYLRGNPATPRAGRGVPRRRWSDRVGCCPLHRVCAAP